MHLVKEEFILLLAIQAVAIAYEDTEDPPCYFNALCTCSKPGPDLGEVKCHNVPFMAVPSMLNHSTVFILSFINNRMRTLEENSLYGTGMWKLQIHHNPITNFPPKALAGLGKTLTILDLSHNELSKIPRKAIENMEKLQTLNLAWNYISELNSDDLFGVRKTLKSLDLSGNSLIHISNNVFRNLESLEVLNLTANTLATINDITFQGCCHNLKFLHLGSNRLPKIPFGGLATLKNIRVINLSNNIISSISDNDFQGKIYLEELHLSYNDIKFLPSSSFETFPNLNRIYLQGNPLTTINDNAFSITNVTEIYMAECLLSDVSSKALQGLENTLNVLDLSYNNLTMFPEMPFTNLKRLNLRENKIGLIQKVAFKSFESTLQDLDISGGKMSHLPSDIIENMSNMRHLSFNKGKGDTILQGEFKGKIETLSMVKNSINTIENGAFEYLSGIKKLDLSFNNIKSIGSIAFEDIKQTLENLVLHKAISMTVFPVEVFRSLSKLEYLDISSNRLTCIPPKAFTSLRNLKYLNLNHNSIATFNSSHFGTHDNRNLIKFQIAFNKINHLESHVFDHLNSLMSVHLNDNIILSIKKFAFTDLENLIYINLEGNVIAYIENEAFQNLPKLQVINLAYNKLCNFNLIAFNQVGRLSTTLRIDVPHNEIQQLSRNDSIVNTFSNIEVLNFSYNNISIVDNSYFAPVRHSLRNLDLSHNQLQNLTDFVFNVKHLQVLSTAYNKINLITKNAFRGLENLQFFNISSNTIVELPEKLLEQQKKLRIFDASRNNIRGLPSNMFKNTVLEILDFSDNQLNHFPENSLFYVNKSLQYLDLSGNNIDFLNFNDIKYLGNLKILSLSNNELKALDGGTLRQFSKMIALDLSDNPFEKFPETLFQEAPKCLEIINLSNTNLTFIPSIDASDVISLNLSQNYIQFLDPNLLINFSNVQSLDLSDNRLSLSTSTIWHLLPRLRNLHLCGNPIQNINNESFINLEKLQELFMKNLNLHHVEKGAFKPLISLRKLEVNTYPKLNNFNIVDMLNKHHGLQEIHLHVQEYKLSKVFKTSTPRTLQKIVLEGKNLKEIEDHAFETFNSKELIVDIHNTNITKLSGKLFHSMKQVQNLTALLKDNNLQTVGSITRILSATEDSRKHLNYLELSGNQLHCDCSFAWVWEWVNDYDYQQSRNKMLYDDNILKDLRETKCLNKNNHSLVDVFKTDLQCLPSNLTAGADGLSYNWKIFNTVIFLLIIKII